MLKSKYKCTNPDILFALLPCPKSMNQHINEFFLSSMLNECVSCYSRMRYN